MVAQDKPPVSLLDAVGRGFIRQEPVIRRVIIAKLDGRRPGSQADEPAPAALNNLEGFGSRAIEPVCCGEQHPDLNGSAGGAGLAGEHQAAGLAAQVVREALEQDQADGGSTTDLAWISEDGSGDEWS